MKKEYISANCEIMMVGAQDIVTASVISTAESNGGMVLNWGSDGSSLY